jgi:hypothetical protein
MPRTPAPLTADRHNENWWVARDVEQVICGWFPKEADARAFVALPALEQALRDYGAHYTNCPTRYKPRGACNCGLDAALAQADGPAPTEEK